MEITNEETKKCNDELERSNLKPTIRIVNSFGPIIQISIKTQEGKKTLSNISEDFKKCFDCGEIKRQDEFSNNSTSKDGKRHICKPCESIKNYSHRSTFDGFFSKLFSHAKEGAEKRRKKRRLEAGMIDITLEYLKGLWDKQDGKCFYSGIQMQTKPNSDWKCSVERLDPDKGYIKGNVILACHELNCRTQWSIEKIKKLIELIKIEYNPKLIIEEITESLKPKIGRKQKKLEQKTIDNIEYYKCKFCDEYFPREEFVKEISKGCKKCRSKNSKDYHSSIRGKLTRLVNSARSSTKSRENKNTNRIDNLCTIEFDNLVEILIKQKGLCAYSGIKMNYGSEDWTISLERINSLKGYTKDNICLICLEFNGSDYSASAKYSNGGSGGWNKEKFDFFIKSVKDKYGYV